MGTLARLLLSVICVKTHSALSGPTQIRTGGPPAPQRRGSVTEDGPCGGLLELRLDVDVQAVRDCRRLEGLTIADGVTSLTPLENLSSVDHLTIRNSALLSLSGLEHVLTVGELSISGNHRLVSLAGLESLTSVQGKLAILANPRLDSLSALQSLQSIGEMTIQDNPNLTSFAGVSKLKSIHGDAKISRNDELFSLSGLGGLTSIEGDLEISENPKLTFLGLWGLQAVEDVEIEHNDMLSSLAGLDNLVSLDGGLTLEGNARLSSLNGLHHLQSTKGLKVIDTSALQDLTGLENLTSVKGDIEITSNSGLLSLTGLQNLRRVEHFKIFDNAALASLSGLEGFESMGSLVIEDDDELLSLAGLDNLVTVDGTLQIESNRELSSLSGLEGLKTAGVVWIRFNWGLTSVAGLRSLTVVEGEFELAMVGPSSLFSLEGLESLTTVGQLRLKNLHGLKSLHGLTNLVDSGGMFFESLQGLSSLVGMDALQHTAVFSMVEVGDPQLAVLGGPWPAGATADVVQFDEWSWPACITPHEREAVVKALVLPHLSNVPSASWERWRKSSCGWELFTCVKGQACRFILTSNHGSVQSIFISDRRGGCGKCSAGQRLSRNVTWDGEVDFGFALSHEEAGSRAICRCGAAVGPLTQLSLRGPWPVEQPTICARGSDCTVELEGEGLGPRDLVVLSSSCEVAQSSGYAASWVSGSTYVLNSAAGWYGAPPNRYEVCWRALCATDDTECQRTQEKGFFKAGYVELSGVYGRSLTHVLGQNLSVPNIGFGVADGDRMRLKRVCGKADENVSGTLDASSSGMVFDFGLLTLDRVLAGTHHLCWCRVRERDGVECNAEEQFLAQSGSVEILCPAGQEFTHTRSCHRCPAGRHQPRTGLEPCLSCPAGEFSAEGAVQCKACQDGTHAPLAGSSVCVSCQPWQSADEDGVGCSTDPGKVALVMSFFLAVGLFCVKLVQVIRVKHLVVDVSLGEGRTMVTTLKSHGLSQFGADPFQVKFENTGHPLLDSATPLLRARVKDAARLELLTSKGSPLKKHLDTSVGTLVVPFPRDLYHTGWLVPMAVALPLLWITIMALGGMILVMVSDMGPAVYLGAPLVALVCTGVSTLLRLQPHTTPLAHRLAEFALEGSHSPQSTPKGPDRAISIGKLHELLDFFRDFLLDRTAYYLTANVLVPLTRASKLSYAEWTGPGEVMWFVSHFWGTPFQHFCVALQKHAQATCSLSQEDWTSVRYWVCFCSNNQHYIEHEIGDSWKDSSFYLALRSRLCCGTCMVLDDQALPLTRAWCIFELLQTLLLERNDVDFEGLLLCTSSGVLNQGSGSVDVAMALARRVVEMDLESARASKLADQEMICSQVARQLGDFSELNRFVRSRVRTMLMSASHNAGEQFGSVLASMAHYVESCTL